MQKRILPLLALCVSSHAYSENSNNASTDDSVTTTPISAEATQKESTAVSNTSEPSLAEDGIDEELISELLAEDDSASTPSESTQEVSTPETTTATEATKTSQPANTTDATQTIAPISDDVNEELISDLLDEEAILKEQKKAEERAKKEAEELNPSNSKWLPEIELGYRSETGNDDEESLNARVALGFTKGRFRNNAEFTLYLKDEDGDPDEREKTYEWQSDYKLGPKLYSYGSFKGIDSEYDAYFHDYTFSAGLGYQIMNTEAWKIETELGPGYRYQEPNDDEIDDDDPIFPDDVSEAIVRANLGITWKPLDNLSFNVDTTMVSGDSNTRFDTELSIISNVSEDIAIKIAQTSSHVTEVPNNLDKTDTVTTINILYAPK
ncbi:MAG: YdiY family protein [Vibrio sp.]